MNLSERLIWLRRSRLLEMLDDEILQELAQVSPDRRYGTGDTIFAPGDEASSLYLLKQGSVLLIRYSPDGKEKVVGLAGPGDLFGELLLTPSLGRRRSHALAREEAVVCSLNRVRLLGLMTRRPQLAIELIRLLATRLLQSHDEIEALSFESTESR
ncbi:MAG: Crp/Fnr family transcriptional regulator, partial [Armatimonadetes bacterium]|nr:Crp/Fnr family transcriptional regulator [Armatimonadota bacterium]